MDTKDTLTAPQPHQPKVGRGVFLGLVGVTGAYLAVGDKLGHIGSPGSLLGNVLGSGKNVAGFTIYTINGFPAFDPHTYKLRIDGLVNDPREYSYHDILRMPAVSEVRYYQCVTGWIVPKPRWQGVRLWDVIQASHPKGTARALRFTCMDGAYSESLTFDQARVKDVLLAYGLNGRRLSQDQGLPLRLVVPGMYGYKFAKWVNHIEVVDKVVPGYWENNGYDVDAYIGRSNNL